MSLFVFVLGLGSAPSQGVERTDRKLTIFVSGQVKKHVLEVESRISVEKLKEMIAENGDIAADAQYLLYQDKRMKDAHTLGYYKIKNESTVSVFSRYAGGAPKPRVIKTTVKAKATTVTTHADHCLGCVTRVIKEVVTAVIALCLQVVSVIACMRLLL